MRQASSDTFPEDFTFGVATAAYQVEGHIENDWSEWERAGRLNEPGMRCGAGVDHWRRYREDYALAHGLGARAFRMSLEWARIEPVRGRFDEAVLAAYRERLLAMRAAGLRPVVTLHHFTHPAWFHRETPWHEPESVSAFRAYARVCAQLLRGLDALVLTLNEPMVLLLGGYLQGIIPPGISDGRKLVAAAANLVRAHVAAREEVHVACGPVPMGISQNMLTFAPDRPWHPLDRALCRLGAQAYNHAFLEALSCGVLRLEMPGVARTRQVIPGARDAIEFVGMNYYTRAHLRFVPRPPFITFHYRDRLGRGLTHIGWEDYPEGFGQMLRETRRYGLPVWITENGIDDREGSRRPHYLHTHWQQLLAARREGVDVRGYLHWSLMDNFEWLEGWGPRFGLYRVDFETLERTETPACGYFREVALGRRLTEPRVIPGALWPPGTGRDPALEAEAEDREGSPLILPTADQPSAAL